MTITVLAGSHQETNAFARQKGLGYGVRHIVSARTLEGARPRELHVLPSFYKRRDVHAINATLKRVMRRSPGCRRIEYELLDSGVYVVASGVEAALEAPDAPPAPAAREPKAKVDPKKARVNAVSGADTSKDAVPGQLAIEDLAPDAPPVAEFADAEAAHEADEEADRLLAEQNFRSAPSDDSLDFLDS